MSHAIMRFVDADVVVVVIEIIVFVFGNVIAAAATVAVVSTAERTASASGGGSSSSTIAKTRKDGAASQGDQLSLGRWTALEIHVFLLFVGRQYVFYIILLLSRRYFDFQKVIQFDGSQPRRWQRRASRSEATPLCSSICTVGCCSVGGF